MKLTPKQLEMQNVILLAVHSLYTLEEAVEKEFISHGIILDCTLPRVLTSLGDNIILGIMGGIARLGNLERSICDRKLLNDDGTDCNLFDQSQDTQDAIHKILCG